MSKAGAITVELRRSQAVHERAGAGLASYEPEYDPEGLTGVQRAPQSDAL